MSNSRPISQATIPRRTIPSRGFSATRPELRGIGRSRIIGVAIDPAKSFHKVLIFDFNVNIIEGPFEIDVLRSGWEQLLEAIDRAKQLRRAQLVIIGMEASGSYSWHLTRELSARFKHVYLFNPLAVATARKQKLLLGQKTDAIDVAVMGNLLLRGEGYPVPRQAFIYTQLRELAHWHHHKAYLIGKLKQQLVDRFEKVFPGVSTQVNGTRPLIAQLSRHPLARGLIEQGLSPHTILGLSETDLRERLKPYLGKWGKPSPRRIQARLQGFLYGPEESARLELGIMKRDLAILQAVEREINEVEYEMVKLVKQTPGRYLLGQIRGISDMQVASYIGALGDPTRFKSAKEAYSLAGLAPRQHQSGTTRSHKRGITKSGRKLLRTVLFQMGCSASLHEPIFRDYRHRLREQNKKAFRTAQIATCNKLNRVLLALIRDRAPFHRGDAASKSGS